MSTIFETRNKFFMVFPSGSAVKNPPAKAGDVSLIPGSGRAPGEGNGNSLQYSCLGNSMDRGALWAIVHRVAKESDTTKYIHTHISSVYYSLLFCVYLRISILKKSNIYAKN